MAAKLHWALVICALLVPSIAAKAADVPTVSGPVTGGAHGRPFGSSLADLAGPAYVEEEYFIAGTATAYDAAAAGIFSVSPGNSLQLTSARIYETGVKAITDDKRAEFTFAAYDIERRNVYVFLTNAVATLAGEVHTRGVELSAAWRPIDPLRLWGNVAITESRYGDFDVFTGNTPSNVAPVIINAGRGGLQNEGDILACLDDGTLGAASLDVFTQEPLPADSPFWTHPKVVLTPHNAADTDADEISKYVARQIERFEAGGTLDNVVDRSRGY